MNTRWSLFCVSVLSFGLLSVAPVSADTWGDAYSAFQAGRSSAQSAHQARLDATIDAGSGRTDVARGECESAARHSQDALQKLGEAREALAKGIANGEIGPEAARLLKQYIGEYEALARESAATAAGIQLVLTAPAPVSSAPIFTPMAPQAAPQPVVIVNVPAPVAPAHAVEPAPSPFTHGTPTPGALKQGDLGTCHFLAAVEGLVRQRPQDVVKLIQDHGDGHYTVRFPGQEPVEVVYQPSTHAQSGEDGPWASVLEQAYTKLVWFNGGSNSKGLELLTGHSTDTDELGLTFQATTRTKLMAAMRDRCVVTAGVSNLGEEWWKKKFGYSALPSGHTYTVVSFDAESDIIVLRNPWGLNIPNGGIITLTLDEFDDRFSDITYEELPEPVQVGVLGQDRAQENDRPFLMTDRPIIEPPHPCSGY